MSEFRYVARAAELLVTVAAMTHRADSVAGRGEGRSRIGFHSCGFFPSCAGSPDTQTGHIHPQRSRPDGRSVHRHPARAPHQVELEIDHLGRAVIIRLGADADETVAQAPLERAEALPFQPIERVPGRVRLRDDVARELPSPVGVVTLGAREVELALAPVEGGAAASRNGCVRASMATSIGRPRDWRATYAVSARSSRLS